MNINKRRPRRTITSRQRRRSRKWLQIARTIRDRANHRRKFDLFQEIEP